MRGLEGQGIHDQYKIGNGRGKVKRGLGRSIRVVMV
jgi:hypothetical protein